MLILDSKHLQAIQNHAQRAYPHECCGLLLGTMTTLDDVWQKQVQSLYGAENTWDQDKQTFVPTEVELDTTRRYWISPQVLLTAQKQVRSAGWEIIGTYHSHPDHPAVPSECDRQWAWPQYSYIIVSVENATPKTSRSWMLDDDHVFQPEPMQMTDRSTEPVMRYNRIY